MRRWLLFLTVLLGVDLGVHGYIYLRLVRDPGFGGAFEPIVTWTLATLAIALPLRIVTRRRLPAAIVEPVAAALYAWMGMAFFLLVVLAGFDAVRLFLRGIWVIGSIDPPPVDEQTLSRIGAITAMATAGGATVASLRSALVDVQVREVPVTLDKLPPALSGLKIVQLSDLHIGHNARPRFASWVAEKVRERKPDLVVITGDLVDGKVETLLDKVAPLKDMGARWGTYFVTGNHEYYSGAGPWLDALERLGIGVLKNELITVGDSSAKIELAGVHDLQGGAFGQRADVDRALSSHDPDRELVLLAHQPRQIQQAEGKDVGLQLSGHTHGGQIWPFTHVVKLVHPYVAGLYKHDERTQVYVSRGTGYWGPPMRLFAPAEITEIVLT